MARRSAAIALIPGIYRYPDLVAQCDRELVTAGHAGQDCCARDRIVRQYSLQVNTRRLEESRKPKKPRPPTKT